VVYEALVPQTTVRGWSSIICLQLLFSGAILTALGLIGDYVARIYEEEKHRPLYVLADLLNVGPGIGVPARSVVLTPRDPGVLPQTHSHEVVL
jgi:hypothetical protein